MIDLYTWTTPNGRKASIMLEECGLDYTVHAINIGAGEQHEAAFRAVSPNGRIPAIVDHDAEGGSVSVFESGAILIHLAEKTGKFLPQRNPERAKTLEWLMWQMGGIGPMIGQLGHFMNAKEQLPYAIRRYRDETIRLIGVMNGRLSSHDFIAGDYSIADMAIYPWVAGVLRIFKERGEDAAAEWDATYAWAERVAARPAVQKGMQVPPPRQ